MANRDYYEVLGVTRGAADNDIKNAFRELAKLCHPDRNPGDVEAERRFKEINEAYDALKDANKRAVYNHHLDAEAEEAALEVEPTGSLWQGFAAVLIMIVVLGGASVLYYVFWLKHNPTVEQRIERQPGSPDRKKDQEQLGLKPKPGAQGPISATASPQGTDKPVSIKSAPDRSPDKPGSDKAPSGQSQQEPASTTPGAGGSGEAQPPSRPAGPTAAALWEKLRESDDLLMLQDFIEKHQSSAEATQARTRLQRAVAVSEDMMALEALAQLSQSRVSSDLETPDLARKRITELKELRAARAKDDSEWSEAEKRGDAEAVLGYLREWPNGQHAQAARDRLAALGLVEIHMGSKGGDRGTDDDSAADSKEVDRKGWFTGGEGQSFRDCAKCPEMVIAPAGEFKMGSPESEEGRGQSEGPRHEVRLAKPFAIGKFEVTFDEWDACVAGGGCRNYKPAGVGSERGQRPVSNVSWEDAQAYVQWLKRRTGKSYRLPTEAEWEYAARAGTDTPYWWGTQINPGQVNYGGERGERGERGGGLAARPANVDAYEPNRWGLHQVAGNVWEWVEDCWHENYRGAPTDGRPWGEEGGGDCYQRALRGGSWMSGASGVRSAHRGKVSPSMRDLIYGFRVARDL